MKIQTLGCIAILVIASCCSQLAINIKQAVASQDTLTSEEMQKIQKVIKKGLKGFANRDISSIMETISPNYSRVIDNIVIDYAGYKIIAETTDAKFFSDHLSCSLNNMEILQSNIADNKAVIEFKYRLYVFNKTSMQWVTYEIIQEVTLSKEDTEWVIITSGDRKDIY